MAPKSSSADVTVYIRDVNDNFPEFSEDVYRVSVPENADAGTVLTTISVSSSKCNSYIKVSASRTIMNIYYKAKTCPRVTLMP